MTRPLDLRKKNRLGGVAIRTWYNNHWYHSKKEALYAAALDAQRHARFAMDRVTSVRRQVKFPLVVNGRLIFTWVADFEVTFADDRVEIHEVKGKETEVWKIKRKLFEALYPGRVLKVIR